VRLSGHDFNSALSRRLTSVVLTLLFWTACLSPFARAQKTEQPTRKVVITVKPEYPPLLKHEQIGGLVRLAATVLPSGTVCKVEVRGGNPILAESATAAVMKWKYAPAASQTVEEVSLSFSPH
jgi:TonB family protein